MMLVPVQFPNPIQFQWLNMLNRKLHGRFGMHCSSGSYCAGNALHDVLNHETVDE